MKKHSIQRLLAVLLALVICAMPAFSAVGSAVETVDAKYNPTVPYIHVCGLMSSDIYLDVNQPELGTAWPPKTDSIVKNVLGVLPSLLLFLVTRNYDRFTDKLIPTLNAVMGPSYLDINGDVPNNSGAICEYPPKEEIHADSKLYFDYDWRLDPITLASRLNDFINYVLDASGCEQVVLECHSFGGVITYTYASVYGTEKLKSVLFNASAVYGETFTGDLCQGKLVLDPDALTEYLKGSFDHNNGEAFLNGLFWVLNKIGITDFLCNRVNKVVEKEHDRLYAEVIYPMFGNWPSIWSMVTDEMYEDSFNFVFNGVYAGDGKDHSGMRNKVETFRNQVGSNKAAILNALNDDANFYVVCRYGYCSMFCTPSWKVSNDMIVDVKCASFGATAAPYGETFSDEYLSKADMSFVSPDKRVDASTCLFPEQTWFIREYMHMHPWLDDFANTLLYAEEQATVNTFAQYPRFLYYTDDGEFLPDQ